MKLQEWITNNLWSIIIAIVGIIVMWTTQTGRIESIASRVHAVEVKQATYPSQDWFELKFKTIDDSLSGISGKLDTHLAQ